MSMSKPTWDVVVTVDEHPGIVQTMVAWHLSQGAARVFLFCDRGDDPVALRFAHLREVTVYTCDTAFWQTAGIDRPARLEDRQVHNATAAYRQSKADWIIHIDADEYLWTPQGVADTLAQATSDAEGLVVPVAERMHRPDDKGMSIYEGGFRRPFHGTGKEGRAQFGRAYYLTYKGLSAHAQGKTFVRTGKPLGLSIHRARSDVAGRDPHHIRLAPNQIELLHFDGLTPLHWRCKLARMAAASRNGGHLPLPRHRQRQLAAFEIEQDDLYPRLKAADPKLRLALEKHDLWTAPACDPLATLAHYFPTDDFDLRPVAIDDWLRQNRNFSEVPNT